MSFTSVALYHTQRGSLVLSLRDLHQYKALMGLKLAGEAVFCFNPKLPTDFPHPKSPV